MVIIKNEFDCTQKKLAIILTVIYHT